MWLKKWIVCPYKKALAWFRPGSSVPACSCNPIRNAVLLLGVQESAVLIAAGCRTIYILRDPQHCGRSKALRLLRGLVLGFDVRRLPRHDQGTVFLESDF